jgi:hypothetical protein
MGSSLGILSKSYGEVCFFTKFPWSHSLEQKRGTLLVCSSFLEGKHSGKIQSVRAKEYPCLLSAKLLHFTHMAFFSLTFAQGKLWWYALYLRNLIY